MEFPAPLAVCDSDILITSANGAPSTAPIWTCSCAVAASSLWCWAVFPPISAVESTARAAWEHGYELVIAEDVCSAQNAEMHRFAFEHIFRVWRVRDTGEILAALDR